MLPFNNSLAKYIIYICFVLLNLWEKPSFFFNASWISGRYLWFSSLSIFLKSIEESKTTFPFLKNVEIDLGMLYPLIVILVITGTSNAVNLTDGLDGLAAGLLAISFTVFAAIAYISGRVDFSDYLNIIYFPLILF